MTGEAYSGLALLLAMSQLLLISEEPKYPKYRIVITMTSKYNTWTTFLRSFSCHRLVVDAGGLYRPIGAYSNLLKGDPLHPCLKTNTTNLIS